MATWHRPRTDKLVWLSQTTLSVDETLETVDALGAGCPGLDSPPSDDICYATQNRQTAVKVIAPRCDVLIVVGSANSSNSVRLLEVGLQYGARCGHRIDPAAEIDPAGWRPRGRGAHQWGVVPEILVRDVLIRLAELASRGRDVDASTSDGFAPPPELRRDLKAAGRM